MKNAAAIAAQLVDVRNVGQHKCVKLTLHVPAEQAGLVMAAFGWPTAVEPVPVAVARLVQPAGKEVGAETKEAHSPEQPASGDVPARAPWNKLARLAGMLCKEPLFHRYVEATTTSHNVAEDSAAEFIRWRCHVKSRSHISAYDHTGTLFLELYDDFAKWRDADKFVEA